MHQTKRQPRTMGWRFVFLALVLAAVLGQMSGGGIWSLALLLSVIGWTGLARLVRGEVLSLREREFVTAAEAIGTNSGRIIFKHILPNTIGTIIVSATLAIAALSMRQILVQRARARRAAKRGGDPARITLDEQLLPAPSPDSTDEIDLVALDDALTRLAELNARQAKVVELRYFGGLGVEETASALDISPATVKRDWTLARAWLKRELGAGG